MLNFPFWHARSTAPVSDLASALFDSGSDVGYREIDVARKQFRRSYRSLDDALLGLKLINLAIIKHEYERRAVATIGKPLGFMLDPANQCQLGCPSCTNTVNREFSEQTFNQWPRGMMSPDCFEEFMRSVALTSFSGHFYNNNEPFLNKHTPDYLRAAADLRIETFVSSNMSYAKIDAEAIVKSGLNELMVAIDGTTQEEYEKYRKRGRIDWVLANVRAIADTKHRLGSPTPYLRWQFLSFAHNVHQVPDAIRLARETGFDTFNVSTPFNVARDDPKVLAVKYEGPAEHVSVVFNDRPPAPFVGDLAKYEDIIKSRLAVGVVSQWKNVRQDDKPVSQSDPVERCDWLNMAVIGDATGRILPCCMGDYKNQGPFVFATIGANGSNLMNSDLYREARYLLANRTAYRESVKEVPPRERVRCNKCSIRPKPQIGLGAVAGYFINGNNRAGAQLGSDTVAKMTGWSQHTDKAPNYG